MNRRIEADLDRAMTALGAEPVTLPPPTPLERARGLLRSAIRCSERAEKHTRTQEFALALSDNQSAVEKCHAAMELLDEVAAQPGSN